VVVVEVGEGAEEARGGAAAVADHDALLAHVGVVGLDDRAGNAGRLAEDVLVDLLGPRRRLGQEVTVADLVDVQLVAQLRHVDIAAVVGLVHHVETQVLLLLRRHEAR
jgi:hypothetical protein